MGMHVNFFSRFAEALEFNDSIDERVQCIVVSLADVQSGMDLGSTLATDDASSPVWFVPMLIYGAAGGIMTVLIRNIGAYIDGVILAILVVNLISPLLDKIRPKALGKVV